MPLLTTLAVALGIADRVWGIGDLLEAALSLEPNRPCAKKATVHSNRRQEVLTLV
jgi:hypothetical protein